MPQSIPRGLTREHVLKALAERCPDLRPHLLDDNDRVPEYRLGGEPDALPEAGDVDESGSEGAAGSGITIKKGPHPVQFVADRPFLFLVRDRSTGRVLFLGRVANPAS